MIEGDTIAAVSTSFGEAGVGIVRISGPGALGIADRIFVSPKGKSPAEKSHRVLYGYIEDPSNAERIDEVLLTVMKAPYTYTREDVAEINCHGGVSPVRRVLELVLKEGARLAEPGEFTRRAFLNGRIDLSQAEAVIDLIRAKTAESERLALSQLEGAISARVNVIKDNLVSILAHLEAHIDFPEEDIEPASLESIKADIKDVMEGISNLASSYEEGRFFREGCKVVIAGRPNVGKSSLLNALLMRDRAIVAEMPGTTRDVIEEYLNIKGLPVKIVDTAGIRQSHDMAEKEGVRRSLRAIEEADLVIAVLDGSEALCPADGELMETLKGRKAIFILNKMDIARAADAAPEGFIRVSAKTGLGLEELKNGILDKATGGNRLFVENTGVIITNQRHKAALDASSGCLKSAIVSLEAMPLEITAIELREAMDRLGEIAGGVTAEDVLDRIFNDFCIGK